MSEGKPRKQRRLSRSTIGSMGGMHENSNPFSLHSNFFGGEESSIINIETRRIPLELTWAQIHHRFVVPLALRRPSFQIERSETHNVAQLHGYSILVLSALKSSLTESSHDPSLLELYGDESHIAGLFCLLGLLDDVYNLPKSFLDGNAGVSDAFTCILELSLVLDTMLHRDSTGTRTEDKLPEWNLRERAIEFRHRAARLLKLVAPKALTNLLGAHQSDGAKEGDRQSHIADVYEIVRHWCLAIVSWSRTSDASSWDACLQILHTFACVCQMQHSESKEETETVFIASQFSAASNAIRSGNNSQVNNSWTFSFLKEGPDEVQSTPFSLLCLLLTKCSSGPNVHQDKLVDDVATFLQRLQAAASHLVLQDNDTYAECEIHSFHCQDAAACLYLLAKRISFRCPAEPDVSLRVRLLYKSLVDGLTRCSLHDSEHTDGDLLVARLLVLGIDALLQNAGPLVKTFLDDETMSFDREELDDRQSCVFLRDIVRILVQVILDPIASRPSTMTMPTEALLVDWQPLDSPEVASARVLTAYFEVILVENVRHRELFDNHNVKGREEEETKDLHNDGARTSISLNDVVSICLVALDSRNDRVVSVVASFLCRQLKQHEGLAQTVLPQRPDLQSRLALVVKRTLHDDNSSDGRLLAIQVAELWLVLCSTSHLPLRSWACSTLPRLEAVRSVLVALCHRQDTSPTAVRILIYLSEDVSNHRILAREAGLLATLIRLIRDGLIAPSAAPPSETIAGTSVDSVNIVDRSLIKRRILLLAEAL